jgi:MFS family permease
MLWLLISLNVVALVAIPLLGGLSDRVGRRPVFVFGSPNLRCAHVALPVVDLPTET